LWLLGLTFLLTVVFQVRNPVLAAFVVMGAGLMSAGSSVSNAAKAMEDSDGEEPAKPSGDS
jgi:hypothetical protein